MLAARLPWKWRHCGSGRVNSWAWPRVNMSMGSQDEPLRLDQVWARGGNWSGFVWAAAARIAEGPGASWEEGDQRLFLARGKSCLAPARFGAGDELASAHGRGFRRP